MQVNEALSILGLTELREYTPEEIKAAYKRKAIKYHPDRNPVGAHMMQLINEAKARLDECDFTIKQTFQKEANSENETSFNYDLGDEILAILKALAEVPVTLELAGAWLWISGDTKPYKELFKELGCKWAKRKKMWYFRPEQHKSRNHKPINMDEIRAKYNSTVIKSGSRCAAALPGRRAALANS